MTDRRILSICVALFCLAFVVRFVVWQNNKMEMAGVQSVVIQNYVNDARVLASGDVRVFLAGNDPPSDANVISHPPGYPMLMALVFATLGEGEAFRVVQLALNSFAPVLVFLIAALIFDKRVAIVAATLVTLAPQLAYHSGLLLPDELSVLPVLAAIYFLSRAVEKPSWRMIALCGVSVGVSCWLRSNPLLLPFFFAAAAVVLMPRRWRSAAVLLAASLFVMAPLTIRNAVLFRDFIPISLGSGTTFVEGLGDLDTDGKLGLPKTDEDVMRLDEGLSGATENSFTALYAPHGVPRDRARFQYGLGVVRDRPGWYLAGVARRGLSTLRLERVPAIDPTHDERETTNAILHVLNQPLKLGQRIFITAIFLPLALIGLVTLIARRGKSVVIISILPLYYATVQALLHTEYRYVLATPHIILIFGAVGLVFLYDRLARIIGRRDVSDAAAAE